jgi:uncharacterized protein involved in type VI secretion and phage assembly
VTGIQSDFRQGSLSYDTPQIGVVVERSDPQALGRIKARIPGLCEPSTAWAFPLGAPGGGSAQRGLKWVPALGAEVVIIFIGADPDRPYYMAAQWGAPSGKSEIPADAASLPAGQAEDVHSMEFARYAITVDERQGNESLIIKDKVSGDSIEWDGRAASGPGMVIKASAALIIQVDGVFAVESTMISLNGRKLSDGAEDI